MLAFAGPRGFERFLDFREQHDRRDAKRVGLARLAHQAANDQRVTPGIESIGVSSASSCRNIGRMKSAGASVVSRTIERIAGDVAVAAWAVHER